MPNDDYISVAEAAEVLDRSERTIRNLVDSGELPGTKLGGKYLILRSSVSAIVARAAGIAPGAPFNMAYGHSPRR